MLEGFDPSDIAGIERIIQLAVAPAFLLTGILSLLNLLAARLSRLVDRERALRERLARPLRGEWPLLAVRQRHVHRAFLWAVSAAVLLCLMIVVSFVGLALQLLAAFIVAGLLVAAMGALMVSLLWFLAEVRLAARILPPLDDETPAGPAG